MEKVISSLLDCDEVDLDCMCQKLILESGKEVTTVSCVSLYTPLLYPI